MSVGNIRPRKDARTALQYYQHRHRCQPPRGKGYGESKPIARNTNPDGTDNPVGRQKNRRTEFKILSVNAPTKPESRRRRARRRLQILQIRRQLAALNAPVIQPRGSSLETSCPACILPVHKRSHVQPAESPCTLRRMPNKIISCFSRLTVSQKLPCRIHPRRFNPQNSQPFTRQTQYPYTGLIETLYKTYPLIHSWYAGYTKRCAPILPRILPAPAPIPHPAFSSLSRCIVLTLTLYFPALALTLTLFSFIFAPIKFTIPS